MAITHRVVRIITRLNIGGPAIQALMLTKALAADFPTTLVAGVPPPEEGELTDADVDVHRVDLLRSLNVAKDVRAFRQVRRLLHRERPSILHTHMAKAGAIGRGASCAMFRSRPRTVHTFHGHVLEGYFSPRIENAFVATERWLARRTDVLIAVSDQVRDSLLSRGIGHEGQWRVIRLGFELEPFLRVDEARGVLRHTLDIPTGVPIVGVIGRLAPVKDHALLLESIALLDDVHLVIVGDGEERARLEARAAASDLRHRVHFVGWRRDVPDVISDMDVVALTSVNEGTPVSLIEALTSGRAVVASDVGGVKAVVDPEETGILVRERDPRAFASALERLLRDDHTRNAMAQTGRKRMVDRFRHTRLIEEIRSLYEELTA